MGNDERLSNVTGDEQTAFPVLDDHQRNVLARYGQRRRTEAGEVLFEAGDRDADFHLVLSGPKTGCS